MIVFRQSTRLILLIALAEVALTFTASSAHAWPLIPQVNADALIDFKVMNDTGGIRKDLHIRITHADPIPEPTSVRTGRFTSHARTIHAPNDITLIWYGDVPIFPVPEDDSDTGTLRYKIHPRDNMIRITDAFWTASGNLLDTDRMGNAKLPGFKVVGDPEYTIFNDLSEPMGIRGLQFLVNVPELAFEDIDPGETPGFGPPLGDFVLPPHSSMTFNVPGDLDPGNFFYAQGKVFTVGTGEVVAAFIHGHQAPVPEPSTLTLLGIGTLSLLGYGWRRRKRAA